MKRNIWPERPWQNQVTQDSQEAHSEDEKLPPTQGRPDTALMLITHDDSVVLSLPVKLNLSAHCTKSCRRERRMPFLDAKKALCLSVFCFKRIKATKEITPNNRVRIAQ